MDDQCAKPPPQPSRTSIALPASSGPGSNDPVASEKPTETSNSQPKDHHVNAALSHLERSLRNFSHPFKLPLLTERFTHPWRRSEATPKGKPVAQSKGVERRISGLISRWR